MTIHKKQIMISIISSLIFGVLCFYAGTIFAGSKRIGTNLPYAMNQNSQNQGGQIRGMRGGGNNGSSAGGFTGGQVLSKDANSFTLKLRSGGSLNVLYSPLTQVQKLASTTADDIVVGSEVTVSGSSNADNSLSAQSVQIR